MAGASPQIPTWRWLRFAPFAGAGGEICSTLHQPHPTRGDLLADRAADDQHRGLLFQGVALEGLGLTLRGDGLGAGLNDLELAVLPSLAHSMSIGVGFFASLE